MTIPFAPSDFKNSFPFGNISFRKWTKSKDNANLETFYWAYKKTDRDTYLLQGKQALKSDYFNNAHGSITLFFKGGEKSEDQDLILPEWRAVYSKAVKSVQISINDETLDLLANSLKYSSSKNGVVVITEWNISNAEFAFVSDINDRTSVLDPSSFDFNVSSGSELLNSHVESKTIEINNFLASKGLVFNFKNPSTDKYDLPVTIDFKNFNGSLRVQVPEEVLPKKTTLKTNIFTKWSGKKNFTLEDMSEDLKSTMHFTLPSVPLDHGLITIAEKSAKLEATCSIDLSQPESLSGVVIQEGSTFILVNKRRRALSFSDVNSIEIKGENFLGNADITRGASGIIELNHFLRISDTDDSFTITITNNLGQESETTLYLDKEASLIVEMPEFRDPSSSLTPGGSSVSVASTAPPTVVVSGGVPAYPYVPIGLFDTEGNNLFITRQYMFEYNVSSEEHNDFEIIKEKGRVIIKGSEPLPATVSLRLKISLKGDTAPFYDKSFSVETLIKDQSIYIDDLNKKTLLKTDFFKGWKGTYTITRYAADGKTLLDSKWAPTTNLADATVVSSSIPKEGISVKLDPGWYKVHVLIGHGDWTIEAESDVFYTFDPSNELVFTATKVEFSLLAKTSEESSVVLDPTRYNVEIHAGSASPKVLRNLGDSIFAVNEPFVLSNVLKINVLNPYDDSKVKTFKVMLDDPNTAQLDIPNKEVTLSFDFGDIVSDESIYKFKIRIYGKGDDNKEILTLWKNRERFENHYKSNFEYGAYEVEVIDTGKRTSVHKKMIIVNENPGSQEMVPVFNEKVKASRDHLDILDTEDVLHYLTSGLRDIRETDHMIYEKIWTDILNTPYARNTIANKKVFGEDVVKNKLLPVLTELESSIGDNNIFVTLFGNNDKSIKAFMQGTHKLLKDLDTISNLVGHKRKRLFLRSPWSPQFRSYVDAIDKLSVFVENMQDEINKDSPLKFMHELEKILQDGTNIHERIHKFMTFFKKEIQFYTKFITHFEMVTEYTTKLLNEYNRWAKRDNKKFYLRVPDKEFSFDGILKDLGLH